MRRVIFFLLTPFVVLIAEETIAQRSQKPPLHGQEWMAITGKPLAAVTPGTPGGILVMLAEYGRLSLAEVLEPAIRMADGYPIEAEATTEIEDFRQKLQQWPDSRRVFFPNANGEKGPEPGEIFR